MTELKYLEEVLPAYRAGKTIEDKKGNKYNKNNKHTGTKFLSEACQLKWRSYLHDPIWTIEPDFVSCFEAWEALKEGKRVKVDGNILVYEPIYATFGDKVLKTIYDVGQGATTKVCILLPIEWLDRDDFEVLDED